MFEDGGAFEDDEVPGTASGIAEELLAGRRRQVSLEARELVLVAGLVDAAPRPSTAEPVLPGREHLACFGGEGTPRVPEFLPVELGAMFGCTHASAALMIADALNLRHRHPRLWASMRRGEVRAWQARRIAGLAHALTIEQADELDAVLAPALPRLAWTRALALAEGEIARIAPDLVAARTDAARRARFVRLGRQNPGPGVTSLVAHLDTADAVYVDAAVDRLARALAQQGDTDPLDARRARALGILATPALAAAILADAAELVHEPLPSEPPSDPEPLSEPEPGPAPGTRPWWRARTGDLADAFRHVDRDRLRPPVRLFLHVGADDLLAGRGVARTEGHGPVLLERLGVLLGGAAVRVTQVVDTADSVAVDAYEIPDPMREQVCQAQPFDIAPWGSYGSRSCDLDHTRPWSAGGPTSPRNLGPLGRTAHRARTHGGYRLTQPVPGHWVWRTPLGYCYSVSNQGTVSWGRHVSDCEAAWCHARPSPPRSGQPQPPPDPASPAGPAVPDGWLGRRPPVPVIALFPARHGARPDPRTRWSHPDGFRVRRRRPPRSARRSGSGGRARPGGSRARLLRRSRRRARHRAARAAS